MTLSAWKIFESEEGYQKHIKETRGKKGLKEYLFSNHPDRRLETDKSDIYLGSHGKTFIKPDCISGTSIDVLTHLNGTVYNNDTINWLVSLRPSSVRVTTGMVTCDAVPWRVTIYLEDDSITIRKIMQEVNIGKYGHGTYKDVSKNEPSLGFCVINDYALERIVISE